MAKRISSTAINWSAAIEKFKPEERVKLSAFKAVVDKYLREIASRPAELPKIDWNYYKSRISAPGMVDSFQKNYESFKVPYPTDQGLVAEAEKYNDYFRKKCEVKFDKVKVDMENYSKKLAELEKIMPYIDMTLEEFFMARPDLKIDSDKPKLWPHYIHDMDSEKDGSNSSI